MYTSGKYTSKKKSGYVTYLVLKACARRFFGVATAKTSRLYMHVFLVLKACARESKEAVRLYMYVFLVLKACA